MLLDFPRNQAAFSQDECAILLVCGHTGVYMYSVVKLPWCNIAVIGADIIYGAIILNIEISSRFNNFYRFYLIL